MRMQESGVRERKRARVGKRRPDLRAAERHEYRL